LNFGAQASTGLMQGAPLLQNNVIQGTEPIPDQGTPLQQSAPTGQISENKVNTVDGAAA